MYLQGDFALISPASLVQLLCQERRSVIITAWRGMSEASIQIFEGLIVGARCDGLTGEAAIYQTMVWDSGRFQVDLMPDPPEEAFLGGGWESLLLEAARRRDELEQQLPALPPYPSRQQIDALLADCPALAGLALVGYDGRLLAAVNLDEQLVHHAAMVAGGLATVGRVLGGHRGQVAVYVIQNRRLLAADQGDGVVVLAAPAAGANLAEAAGQLRGQLVTDDVTM